MRPLLMVTMLGSVLLLLGALVLRLERHAEADRADAAAARERAVQERSELLAGAQGPAVVASRRRPDQDLMAELQEALRGQGLPVSALAGVKPRGENRLGDGKSALRLQQVQVQLQALAPHELGAFLNGLRSAGSPWRLVELQLARPREARKPDAEPEVDRNRYEATLTLAAPYLDLPGAATSSEPAP